MSFCSIALEPRGYYFRVSSYVTRHSYLFPLQEYNYGEEFVLLVTFAKNASEKNIKDAMDAFAQLTSSLPSLIVQSTQGSDDEEQFLHLELYFRHL